jgi:hypothetical protein
MQLFHILKEIAAGFLQASSHDWWVEITTAQPRCTYYFGPFRRSIEAKGAYGGYVEDLEGEGAMGIAVNIKRCQPAALTICEE